MAGGSGGRVVLGRLNGAWGVAGWVKVFSHTDPPEAIFDYQPLILGDGAETVEFAEWRRSGPRLVARLAGVESREAAEALGRAELSVARERLPEPAEGRYYWHDLVGLEVLNPSGHRFGRVEGLLDAGVHDVLVIRAPTGGEVLIPFVRSRVVRRVDLAGGTIEVDWEADWEADGADAD